ncbi:MAG: TetR/AcrR family transcriptional regulator, partial [Candidatus Heimdallarchaeota archaeon]
TYWRTMFAYEDMLCKGRVYLTKLKQRNRSLEKKSNQLMIIIAEGRKLMSESGGIFSMRELARRLDVSPSGLYRYVANKRELWYAIVIEDFKLFTQGFRLIHDKYIGTISFVELITKIGVFFLEFAKTNYEKFNLMFLSNPPSSKKESGEFERSMNSEALDILYSIVSKAVLAKEIINQNPKHLTLSYWSYILGSAILLSPTYEYLHSDTFLGKGTKSDYEHFIVNMINTLFVNK